MVHVAEVKDVRRSNIWTGISLNEIILKHEVQISGTDNSNDL